MRNGFNIVIGGQAGSESKGKLSAYLCDKYQVDGLVMTSSPNAGHTAIVKGHKRVSYHLPVGSVACDAPIYLPPASLINPDILEREISELGIDPRRIHLHPRAAIITSGQCRGEVECGLSDIGSTLQGVGACRCNKMQRVKDTTYASNIAPHLRELGIHVHDTTRAINTLLAEGRTLLCEMTQGFDLCLEHGIHRRYCTSKMIHPAMAMAEAGVSPYWVGNIYGVIRPYPIRVNNRTGTSGPYTGAEEITWDIVASECGYPPDAPELREITTTTKLPRRVFRFSWERYDKFLMTCQPNSICLNFANYVNWNDYGVRTWGGLSIATKQFIKSLEVRGVQVEFIGTGPAHADMIHVPKGARKFPS